MISNIVCWLWLISLAHCIINQALTTAQYPNVKLELLQRRLPDFDALAYYETHNVLFNQSMQKAQELNETFEIDDYEAMLHYLRNDAKLSIPYPHRFPLNNGAKSALDKVRVFLQRRTSASPPQQQGTSNTASSLARNTLVVYHLGDADSTLSSSISHNNLLIFAHGLQQDASPDSRQFYWINVMLRKDQRNVFYEKFLRDTGIAQQWNVAICMWNTMPSDMYTHIRTLSILATQYSPSIVEDGTVGFDGVFCMNHGVRGPMYDRIGGKWLEKYYEVMHARLGLGEDPHVGIVGSTISCEVEPHVQTHAFLLRSDVIPLILEEYSESKVSQISSWQALILRYEVSFSLFLLKHGYRMASLFHAIRHPHHPTAYIFSTKSHLASNLTYIEYSKHGIYFDANSCVDKIHYATHKFYENPSTWCDFIDYEVPIMKWGGGQLRFSAYVCNDVMDTMQSWLYSQQDVIALKQTTIERGGGRDVLRLILPEIMRRPRYEVLNEQYLLELQSTPKQELLQNPQTPEVEAKVCFIAYVLDWEIKEFSWDYTQDSNYFNRELFIGFPEFIKGLQRQSDPNWDVVFLRADFTNQVNETQDLFIQAMAELIDRLQDPRMSFANFAVGAKSKTTLLQQVDYLMTVWIQANPSCRWLSILSASTVLGSQAVETIRKTQSELQDMQSGTAEEGHDVDMIVMPLDSYFFPTQQLFQDHNYKNLSDLQWTDMCTTVSQPLVHNLYANMQYPPTVRRFSNPRHVASLLPQLRCPLDVLEGIFFNTQSIQRDFQNVNFFDSLIQEATLLYPPPTSTTMELLSFPLLYTQTILQHHFHWNPHVIPKAGLAQGMFHLPSPTWCIASGNVFLHNIFMLDQKCVSLHTARTLMDIRIILEASDTMTIAQSIIDVDYLMNNGHACIRFSKPFFDMVNNGPTET